jgi:hypothetical protein
MAGELGPFGAGGTLVPEPEADPPEVGAEEEDPEEPEAGGADDPEEEPPGADEAGPDEPDAALVPEPLCEADDEASPPPPPQPTCSTKTPRQQRTAKTSDIRPLEVVPLRAPVMFIHPPD